jgi:hypothetical protein
LETDVHLFIECPFARKVWELVANWSRNPNLLPDAWTEQSELEGWFMAMIEGGTKAAHSIAILTLWHLWKERNAVVFNGERSPEQAVATRIKDECLNWAMAGGRSLSYLRIEHYYVSN